MNLFRVIFENDAHAATAIIYEQLNLSYDQLREQTLTMAKAIAALGPAQTDRVAILLNDSPEFIEAFIATCSLGAIAVPINMALRLEDQLTILNDCSANIAIIEADLCKTLLTDAPEKLRHLQSVVAVKRDNKQSDEHGRPVGIEFAPLRRPPLTVYQLHLLLEQAVSAGAPEFSSP